MNENIMSSKESLTNIEKDSPWSFIGLSMTPMTEDRKRPQRVEQIDTNVSNNVWLLFYEIQGAKETTQLHSDFRQEKLLRKEIAHEKVPEDFGEIEVTSESRTALLARKYVNSLFSREEAARLDILTEKMRHLMPAVPAEDIAIMEDIESKLERISNINDQIRNKYGIKED